MSEIQRYHADVIGKHKEGSIVLYTDHLAAMRELIDTYDLLISQNDIVLSGYKATLKQADKQIAALTARAKEDDALIEALRLSIEFASESRLQVRIKELEENIDKLTCIAYEAEEYVNAQVMLRILTAQKEGV
jgi:hypothetical protein